MFERFVRSQKIQQQQLAPQSLFSPQRLRLSSQRNPRAAPPVLSRLQPGPAGKQRVNRDVTAMDGWPEPQRHKRSFTEMSHSATLSPSPVGYMGPTANLFSAAPRIPPASTNYNLERRRTSHPHNSQLQPRLSEDMPDRSQSQQRPRLEHRASQTIIDLTDDQDEPAPPPRGNRPVRPPALGRSDAVSLGDFIDLTDDSAEQDVIFTGERHLPPNPPRPGPGPRLMNANARSVPAVVFRAHSPSLFLPARQYQPAAMDDRRFAGMAPHGMGIGDFLGGLNRADGGAGMAGIRNLPQNFMDHLNMAQQMQRIQAMPHGLNYQHAAALAEQKPEHVAPPPAREGFTRSPKEDQVLICPSCEEELIQDNGIEEPVVKKSGKAPTKKEREEHPFWVVKECGHVFCNTCFQARTTTGKTGFIESTTSRPKKGKTFTCAVEDCESDVKAKDKWVGVFL
ncbi:hypothetical protein VTL71DRAFT_614 [Oculimacula yallundae]|uniref:Cell cycle control protein n=1 Tax=Oculimacula yallundae TaxID=86028 RepID=A0ABR4D0K8_9HELO